MAARQYGFLPYNPRLRPLARELRKGRVIGEVRLWCALKNKALALEFHRQVPIDEYIVDFYCPEVMLAIEIDGNYHSHAETYEEDCLRQAALEALGVRFLRFPEMEVRRNLTGVVETIRDWLAHHAQTLDQC